MKKYRDIAETILDLAKAKGAQTAYCSVSERETKEFNVEGNEFSLFRTLFDRSVSIVVFLDQRKGAVSINKFERQCPVHNKQ